MLVQKHNNQLTNIKMKDQRKLLNNCIENEIPAIVFQGTDKCSLEILQAAADIYKKHGCSEEFLYDFNLLKEDFGAFQLENESEVKLPKLTESEKELIMLDMQEANQFLKTHSVDPETFLNEERNKILIEYGKNPFGSIDFENISPEGLEKWDTVIKQYENMKVQYEFQESFQSKSQENLKDEPSIKVQTNSLENSDTSNFIPETSFENPITDYEILSSGSKSLICDITPANEKKTIIEMSTSHESVKTPEVIDSILPESKLVEAFGTNKKVANQLNSSPTRLQVLSNFFSKIFTFGNRYTPEVMMNNPYKIKEITNPSKKLQTAAIITDPSVIRFIKNPTSEIQLLAIQTNPSVIQYIQNPSERLQLAAVQLSPTSIQYIKNPTENVQLVAVQNYPQVIEHISNPTETVRLAAVQYNPETILSIKNPKLEMQLEAIRNSNNPELVDALQMQIVKSNALSIALFTNPSEQVQLLAVESDPFVISKINNPSEQVQLAAINKDYFSLSYISNPTEIVQVTAVQMRPENLCLIENPTSNTCKSAVEKMFNIEIKVDVSSDFVEKSKLLFSQIDAKEKNINRLPTSVISKEKKKLLDDFKEEVIAKYATKELPPVSINKVTNLRIFDSTTGKSEPLNTNGVDLLSQSPDTLKKLLSGGKVEILDSKGTSNLYSLTKGPTGLALTIGKQIYSSMESGAEM